MFCDLVDLKDVVFFCVVRGCQLLCMLRLVCLLCLAVSRNVGLVE